MTNELWPPLPLEAWRDSCETLHRYAQIIGKVQLATTPCVNHFWNVALRPSARGFTTSAMQYEARTFDVELDLVDHVVRIRSSDGAGRSVPLHDKLTVANFKAELMAALASLGITVPIWDHPVELVGDATPFEQDTLHGSYDREWVTRYWRVMSQTATVLEVFRARFVGKASPVGLFWGTFDICAARYSGLRAPNPPSGTIEQEAFSHEVSEAGFWPGDARLPEPAFFTLHYPAPVGYANAKVLPRTAFWSSALNCFILPYETMRMSPSPRETLLEFFESSYVAGATLAHWDRPSLEREGRTSYATRQPVAAPDAHSSPR
jgi:Family of unknown function (DUF5996)